MVYFPESVVITTSDGVQFKSFSNEHPEGFIIAKPKYIPVHYIFSDKLQFRNLFHKQVNRLNMWIDKKELKAYLEMFIETYPNYFYKSDLHKNWFFAIPKNDIKQIFDPKDGLKLIMAVKEKSKDIHIRSVIRFIEFLLESGITIENFGVTFSTLVGHYDPKYSDINIVIYGKENAWKLIDFLNKNSHPLLRWKGKNDWERFRQKRNRQNIFSKEEFFEQMSRKRTEGYFDNRLFVLFPVENNDKSWAKWGDEEYTPLGICEFKGTVADHSNSLFRPGMYKIKNSLVIGGKKVSIIQLIFYSRDYVMQAFKGEKIRACGLLEKVNNLKTKKIYYRVVVGYPDSYLNERREKEYIKLTK